MLREIKIEKTKESQMCKENKNILVPQSKIAQNSSYGHLLFINMLVKLFQMLILFDI